MESIKLGDLYLSEKESRNIIELLTRSITIKANLVIDYMKYLKSNLKIKKE